MRTIACMCDKSFEADLPDRIDLDECPEWEERILDGTFFSATCPHCGTVMKPDLEVRVVSGSRGIDWFVIPDLMRLAFYVGKTDVPAGSDVLIGFPELLERTRICRAGLDPLTVEFIKYLLVSKAAQSMESENGPIAFFVELKDGSLVIHLHGLKDGEVAELKVPLAQYQALNAKKGDIARNETFAPVCKGPYRSVRILETGDPGEI